MLQLNSFFEIEKNVVVRTFTIHHHFNGKQKSVSVMHSNVVTQRMVITCSICQMHNACM
jgi:hypothetical protein